MLLAIRFVNAEGLYTCRFLTDCKALADACTSLQPPMEVDWRAQKEIQVSLCCHVGRNHNEVADDLAKRGRLTGESYTGYTYPIFSAIGLIAQSNSKCQHILCMVKLPHESPHTTTQARTAPFRLLRFLSPSLSPSEFQTSSLANPNGSTAAVRSPPLPLLFLLPPLPSPP